MFLQLVSISFTIYLTSPREHLGELVIQQYVGKERYKYKNCDLIFHAYLGLIKHIPPFEIKTPVPLCQHERVLSRLRASLSELLRGFRVIYFSGPAALPQPHQGFALCETLQRVTGSDWPTYSRRGS